METMNDVVADNNVLTSVKEFFENQQKPTWFRIASFAQLVELLVLADRVYVDDKSMAISGTDGFFASLHPEMGEIITGLGISDAERAEAVAFAHQRYASNGTRLPSEWDELDLLRGHFYLYLAYQRGIPYFPSETRAPYLSALEPSFSHAAVFQQVFETFDRIRFEAYALLRERGFLTYRYRPLHHPPLFSYIVGRAQNLRELFEIAIDLRASAPARQFRRWCGKLAEAEREEHWLDAARMFLEVETHMRSLFASSASSPQVELQLSFPPAIGLAKDLPLKRCPPHLLFLKQVLTNQPRLPEVEAKLHDFMRLA
jgi:hypothetical protein